MDRLHDEVAEQVMQAHQMRADRLSSGMEAQEPQPRSRSQSPLPLREAATEDKAKLEEVTSQDSRAGSEWEQALTQALAEKERKSSSKEQVLALIASATT